VRLRPREEEEEEEEGQSLECEQLMAAWTETCSDTPGLS